MGQTDLRDRPADMWHCGFHDCNELSDAWVLIDLKDVRVEFGVCKSHIGRGVMLARQLVATGL